MKKIKPVILDCIDIGNIPPAFGTKKPLRMKPNFILPWRKGRVKILSDEKIP